MPLIASFTTVVSSDLGRTERRMGRITRRIHFEVVFNLILSVSSYFPLAGKAIIVGDGKLEDLVNYENNGRSGSLGSYFSFFH